MKALATLLGGVVLFVSFAGCTFTFEGDAPDAPPPNGSSDSRSSGDGAWWDAIADDDPGPSGAAPGPTTELEAPADPLDAGFDFHGDPLYLLDDGATVARLDAPFTFRSGASIHHDGESYLTFRDARVNGLGPGLLSVQVGDVAAVEAGALAAFKVTKVASTGGRLEATPAPILAAMPHATFPADWQSAQAAMFFGDDIGAVEGLRLDGATRALLLTESGNTTVSGPLVVTAAGLIVSKGTTLAADRLAVETAHFVVGGHVTYGVLTVDDGRRVSAPSAVFGRGGAALLQPGEFRTTTPFRLTQAITPSGLLLHADVTVTTKQATVEVPQGEMAWVKIRYAETSGVGDAVLGDVFVTGNGASLVTVPTQVPPLLVEELWSVVDEVAENDPWAAPFVAIPIVLASPFVAMIDLFLGIVCAFADCPEQHPYPLWMDAGGRGTFYAKASAGDVEAGTYRATVTFVGQNYDEVSVPLTIVVE